MQDVVARLRRLATRWVVVTSAVVTIGIAAAAAAVAGELNLSVAFMAMELTGTSVALLAVSRRTSRDTRTLRATVNRDLRNLRENTARELRGLRETTRRLSAAHAQELSVAIRQLREDLRHRFDDGGRRILTAIDELAQQTSDTAARLRDEADDRVDAEVREIEALFQLFVGADRPVPMPPSAGWALQPSGLLELMHTVKRLQPRLVLELGSGTSTVWLAYALRQTGGHLISIDHDESFAEHTRTMVSRHQLDDVAEVRVAPLTPVTIGDQIYRWYDQDAMADLAGVDLLVVDGPPGRDQPLARYPALPVLRDRLAPDAMIFIDDTERPDEQTIVRFWLEEFGDLTTEVALFGGHRLLRYSRPDGRTPDQPLDSPVNAS